MKYQTRYTDSAIDDLARLPKVVARRIIDKIEYFRAQSTPLSYAKRLANSELGHYRFHIGDYRALFDLNNKGHIVLLMILRIKHRKDIYDL
jgi:mRNA interferase RelE/StbE